MEPAPSGLAMLRQLFQALGAGQSQPQQEPPTEVFRNPAVMQALQAVANVGPNVVRNMNAPGGQGVSFDPNYGYQQMFQDAGVAGGNVTGAVGEFLGPDPTGGLGDLGRVAEVLGLAAKKFDPVDAFNAIRREETMKWRELGPKGRAAQREQFNSGAPQADAPPPLNARNWEDMNYIEWDAIMKAVGEAADNGDWDTIDLIEDWLRHP